MEHVQDETEQRRRQAQGLNKQSCTIVLRGLYHFVAWTYSGLFLFILSLLNKCGYEATKQQIFYKNLPLQLSELTSFRASSYHQEFAFALTVHPVWKKRVMNFSHRSSRAAWYEHGTSILLLTSPFLTWKMDKICWRHKDLALINYLFSQQSVQLAMLLLLLLKYRSSTLMSILERYATKWLDTGDT